MKEISINQKVKVIKLLFSGLTYDEISQKFGIAKGSVVNIVNEFREGYIMLPPDMTEYVDELRKLVVDMKKHDTSAAQLKGYVKLHAKIEEMGVGVEQVGKWLDICQSIATSSVTNNQFIKSALEVAELTSGNGKSPSDVIAEYTAKLDTCLKLDKDIAQKKEEKKQATATLDSINTAIKTAQDLFQKQKQELKSQLDEYMAQNKLSWDKVNIALALLNGGLSDSGLGQEDVKKVSEDIVHAGSLTIYIKQRKSEKAELEAEVDQLATEHQDLKARNMVLRINNSNLTTSVQTKTEAEKQVISVLQTETNRLAQVEHIISCHIDLIGITRLFLNFLTTSDKISDSDIEELTRMIIFIRQTRLGIAREKYRYIDGCYIYECRLPPSYFAPYLNYTVDTDTARKKLATILAPLVKNEFMPRWEWDIKELQAINQKCVNMYCELMSLPIQKQ